MAGRKVWLTWLPSGEGAPGPQEGVEGLSKVGLDVGGAPWQDDLPKAAFSELGTLLSDPAQEIWVIAGREEDFASESIRFGLSLVMAMVRDAREILPLIFVVGLDHLPQTGTLPTLLRGANAIDGSNGKWPAKAFIASHNKKGEKLEDEFRFNATCHQYIGHWLEIGPARGTWKGAMLGVTGEGAEIVEHAVGRKNEIPERTVYEFASKGIKAEIGGDEYVAWSVQNELDPEHSYYVKFVGHPSKVLIGEHPAADDAEAWTLALK